MGDVGDTFNLYKAERKKKKKLNRESSTEYLKSLGIDFESKNGGVHLIVKSCCYIDFWPSTGKWIVRGSGKTGRGVRNMTRYLESTCKKVEK